MTQVFSAIISIIMFLFPMLNVSHINVDKSGWKTDYDYVYCHGLSGWGSYDIQNVVMPYWGMLGGHMIINLNSFCRPGRKRLGQSVRALRSAYRHQS